MAWTISIVSVPVRDDDEREEHRQEHGRHEDDEEELVEGRRHEVPLELEVARLVDALGGGAPGVAGRRGGGGGAAAPGPRRDDGRDALLLPLQPERDDAASRRGPTVAAVTTASTRGVVVVFIARSSWKMSLLCSTFKEEFIPGKRKDIKAFPQHHSQGQAITPRLWSAQRVYTRARPILAHCFVKWIIRTNCLAGSYCRQIGRKTGSSNKNWLVKTVYRPSRSIKTPREKSDISRSAPLTGHSGRLRHGEVVAALVHVVVGEHGGAGEGPEHAAAESEQRAGHLGARPPLPLPLDVDHHGREEQRDGVERHHQRQKQT